MRYRPNPEVTEEILAAAVATAIDNQVVMAELVTKSGYSAGRVDSVIRSLRRENRWPFQQIPRRPEAPKPKREKRPSIDDIEAYRAWADRERDRLTAAAQVVLVRNTKAGKHITKFGKARERHT